MIVFQMSKWLFLKDNEDPKRWNILFAESEGKKYEFICNRSSEYIKQKCQEITSDPIDIIWRIWGLGVGRPFPLEAMRDYVVIAILKLGGEG